MTPENAEYMKKKMLIIRITTSIIYVADHSTVLHTICSTHHIVESKNSTHHIVERQPHLH